MSRFRWSSVAVTCLGLGSLLQSASPTSAMAQGRSSHPSEALGHVAFGVACDSAVVVDFDRALALLHHMTYPEAFDGFRSVTERDPGCALGYWGAAMTLFQPLWPNRPTPEDLRAGWDLVQEARHTVVPGGREAMFVAAGEAFFDPRGDPDHWVRIDRWAAAVAAAQRAYPADIDARAFLALARLATSGRSGDAAGDQAEAAAILGSILDEEPNHPGAVHYTIHANDFTGRQGESLEVVRRYGEMAPANAHALHMPTHIFVRRGEWDDVIDGNRRAAAAARPMLVGLNGRYVSDEYPHAVEYLVYAELQRADDGEAEALIRTLNRTPDLQPTFKTAFHLSSVSARYAVERQDWEAAAAIPARSPEALEWDRFPWPEAVSWFARGLGSAHTGDDVAVASSLDRLAALRDAAASSGEQLFASQIEILRLEVAAWRAFAGGEAAEAIARSEDAVALEGRTPKHAVTPGATLPAWELLGDLHAALGDPARAREAYRQSDLAAPGRFNTRLGLARTSAALGDLDAAHRYYRLLLEGVSLGSTRAGVSEARAALSGG